MRSDLLGTATNGVANSKYEKKPCLGEQCFVIRPNASMSPKCAWVVFLGIVILSLIVMTRFVLLGAWMVVPFTVAEVVFVGVIFWLVIRSNQCVETLIYKEDELLVIQESYQQRREWSFQPYWAEILLQSGRHVWYPDRLLIKSHGKSLEVGKCLTGSERTSLAEALCALPLKKQAMTETKETHKI